ncbi:EamA family transporter [Arcticibacter eurypsychrophilus]|uniref:EamA family transporter n=1 Tax=Arcticibacter eurypsychrophilus TaxID=1434752 RepID=UPI00084D3080|nr:EamA family transporter [Arcticibacter eurypsychrophilus]
MKQAKSSFLLVIIAFATVYIVWGSTYFFIQKAVLHIPPFVMGSIRFLIAGGIMLSWSALKGEKIFRKDLIRSAGISGLLLLFVGNGCVIWVEQYIPSGMVAIMVSSAPLWFVLFDKPNWGANFRSLHTILGLVVGFAGVILLFWNQVGALFSKHDLTNLPALIMLLIGSMAWSAGSLYSKYYSKSGSAIVNTGWQMTIAGLAFVPGTFILQEWKLVVWESIPTESWLSLLYLIFMGSIAAFSSYVWLLQERPATQVSTYAYVNPVIAVLLGVFFAHEKVSFIQIIGLAIILGSVLLINLSRYRQGKKKLS